MDMFVVEKKCKERILIVLNIVVVVVVVVVDSFSSNCLSAKLLTLLNTL
jgi:hypothetical protein